MHLRLRQRNAPPAIVAYARPMSIPLACAHSDRFSYNNDYLDILQWLWLQSWVERDAGWGSGPLAYLAHSPIGYVIDSHIAARESYISLKKSILS